MRWWSDLLFYLPSESSRIYIWGQQQNGSYHKASDIIMRARTTCTPAGSPKGKQD